MHEIRRIRDTQCAVFGNGIFTILDVDKKRNFGVLFQSAIGRSDRNLSCSNLFEVLNSLCACVVVNNKFTFPCVQKREKEAAGNCV